MATTRTAKRLLLGREIAHMIETAGVSQAKAAAIIESSQSRIAGLINGQGNISPGDLKLLASELGFGDEGYLAALLELRRDNHKRGFWSTGYHRSYGEDLRLLIDLEKSADQIRISESESMPGLLQCEAYINAIYSDLSHGDKSADKEHVQARLARQEIYYKDEAPNVYFVLSESCLRRVWGSAAIMREQLRYVMELSKHWNIMVQVLPFNSPPGKRSMTGRGFISLRVPSPGQAGPMEVIYVEGEGDIRYLDDKKALAAYDSAWARLSATALNYEESRDFINQVINDFSI